MRAAAGLETCSSNDLCSLLVSVTTLGQLYAKWMCFQCFVAHFSFTSRVRQLGSLLVKALHSRCLHMPQSLRQPLRKRHREMRRTISQATPTLIGWDCLAKVGAQKKSNSFCLIAFSRTLTRQLALNKTVSCPQSL